MNEEFLQEIKGMLPWFAAAAIAVGGYYGVKNYIASQRAAASEAVVSAYTAEELEAAVGKFGGKAVGGALRLRLAKKHFDAGRYNEAMDLYEKLEKDPPKGFADVPKVGKAQCLEALGKYAEALAAFDAFARENPKSYLALTAELGAARSEAQAGKRDAALARLKALKDSRGGDELAKLRIESTEDCVRRYAGK